MIWLLPIVLVFFGHLFWALLVTAVLILTE